VSAATFLAADLGAESGRIVLGRFEGAGLVVRELHRFPNRVVPVGRGLHWDLPGLLEEIKRGMVIASAIENPPSSLGVDTWGVDFGLLARDGTLLELPRAYRDPSTEGALESFLSLVPREQVYERTGIQFLPFNSLYQLHAMARARSPQLQVADAVLFMPDLFHYLLTGRRATEFTFATTTQLCNARTRDWDELLLEALGLPRRLFQDIVPTGTSLGPLRDEVREETGLDAEVIAVGTHDTASAIAAVPAEQPESAYISSGTWSLVGTEVLEPVITAESLRFNFTNEGGVGNRFRLLKNVMGLWLLQRCRHAWGIEGSDAYERLVAAAAEAPPAGSFVDPDDPSFFNPPDMPDAIRSFCERTEQPVPRTQAEIVRCVLQSLAFKYRLVLEQLDKVCGRTARVVHVVGGGARNGLLCRLTADATGLPVLAGPEEATALGNLIVQAHVSGAVESLDAGRARIRASCHPLRFEPRAGSGTDASYTRFLEVCGASPQ
jgi:rhamnulokinase